MDAQKPKCWTCTHMPVCRHWWEKTGQSLFPFKSDSEIGPYMNGVAEVMAQACAWYTERDTETTPTQKQ